MRIQENPSTYHFIQAFLFANLFCFANNEPMEQKMLSRSLNIGAIFGERDIHLSAAFNYSLHWLPSQKIEVVGIDINNQIKETMGAAIRLNGFLEILTNPGDHSELLEKVCRLINEHKIVALIGPSDRHSSEQLFLLTQKLHLPYFSLIDPLELHSLDLTGNISPPTNYHLTLADTNLVMFPHTQLLEALVDLIKYWRWSRVIVVFSEPERIRRLIMFLENAFFDSIRFHLVYVEDGNFLAAAKQVKSLEECDDEQLGGAASSSNQQQRQQHGQCSEFSRLLLDMEPRDNHRFLLAALKVGLVEQKHWFLTTSLDIRHMEMELFRHNHARFIGLEPMADKKKTVNLPDFNNFVEYVHSHWMAKNSAANIGDDVAINFKMSEAVLLFDSLQLLAHTFSSENATIDELLSQSENSPARCAAGTRTQQQLTPGRQLVNLLRDNQARGLTGQLSRLSPHPESNFTFKLHMIGYAGTLEPIGHWQSSSPQPLVDLSGESKAQRRRHGIKVSDELKPHFRVTTILERPYVMLKSNEFEERNYGEGSSRQQQNAQFEGFCIDLLMELAEDLGFTYQIHVVKDNKYGSDNGNGSWDGMIGEILRHEADMAVAPLTANFKRAEMVDFTKPFLSLGISIIFRIPEDYQPDIFSFLNPLSLEIWFCILLSICGLTFGMYLVANVTPYEWNLNFSCCTAHQPHPAAQFSSQTTAMTKVELSNNYSFWNTLWYVMSTMLKGGCDFGPRAVSTRLLGGSWWVFTLVIVSAYTANLAAVLTVSRPHIPIRNIDDLANQSDISYGTINGGSTMQFFQESKIEAHAKMWSRMRRTGNVFVRNNREGVEKVLHDKYAFLMESSSLEYEVQQNCNLTQIGGVLGSKGYGIALQKNSEWTDRISRQILLYQKRGIIEMKKTKWWRSKGASCHGVGSSVKQQRISLNLQNVSGLFVILSMGLLISVVIVGLEFYNRKREQQIVEDEEEVKNINFNADGKVKD